MKRRYSYQAPPNAEKFRALVFEIVKEIPRGKVATYGQIAAMIWGSDERAFRNSAASYGARWVGGAMAACPPDIPWQRVINSRGRISPRPGDGPIRQRALLEEEGVRFDSRGEVDLGAYGWEGPPDFWLRAKGLEKPPPLARPFQTEFDL